MKSVLLLKYTLTSLMVYRKKLFAEKNSFCSVDYGKIVKLHVVHI